MNKLESKQEVTQSLAVADNIIDNHILKKCGDWLYDKYLEPKNVPYAAKHSLESIKVQIDSGLVPHEFGEEKDAPVAASLGHDIQEHDWDEPEEPPAPHIDLYDVDGVAFKPRRDIHADEIAENKKTKEKSKRFTVMKINNNLIDLLQLKVEAAKDEQRKSQKRKWMKAESFVSKEPQQADIEFLSWAKDFIKEHENETNKDEIDQIIAKARQHKAAEQRINQQEKEQAKRVKQDLDGKQGSNDIHRILARQSRTGGSGEEFFQKIYTGHKGMTFDQEGMPIVYKQPKLKEDAEFQKSHYQVSDKFTAKQMRIDLLQQKRQMTRQNTAGDQTNREASKAANTMEYFNQHGGGKQGVIESNYTAPSKVMAVRDGVTLVVKGKPTQGDPFHLDGRLSLSDYKKLSNGQVVSKKQSGTRIPTQTSISNEDPYRNFKKHLLQAHKENNTLTTARSFGSVGLSAPNADMENKVQTSRVENQSKKFDKKDVKSRDELIKIAAKLNKIKMPLKKDENLNMNQQKDLYERAVQSMLTTNQSQISAYGQQMQSSYSITGSARNPKYASQLAHTARSRAAENRYAANTNNTVDSSMNADQFGRSFMEGNTRSTGGRRNLNTYQTAQSMRTSTIGMQSQTNNSITYFKNDDERAAQNKKLGESQIKQRKIIQEAQRAARAQTRRSSANNEEEDSISVMSKQKNTQNNSQLVLPKVSRDRNQLLLPNKKLRKKF